MDPLHKAIQNTLSRLGGSTAPADGRLLEEFVASQDQAAFEQLVRRHGPMVLQVCRRVLRHDQDAEDAFQATFIVLARRAAVVARMASVSGWLHGVAYRTALNAKKQRARRGVAAATVIAEKRLESLTPPAAETEALEREFGSSLDEVLQALPEKYRAAIVLCHLEGKTYEQAAEQLHCPTGALRMRLHRACDLVRNRLARRGLQVSAATLATLLAQEASATTVLGTLVTTTARGAALLAAGGTPETTSLSAAVVELANATVRQGNRQKLCRILALLLVLGGAGATMALVARGRPEDGQAAAGSTGVMRRYGAPFRKAAFSPDSRLLALSDQLGRVEVYVLDYEKPFAKGGQKLRLTLEEPGTLRGCVEFAPDGKKLAVGCRDGTVQLWDMATNSKTGTLRAAQAGDVTNLAFSPDGQSLAAAVANGGLTTWNLRTHAVQSQAAVPDSVAAHLVFTAQGEVFAVLTNDNYRVRCWDAATGQEKRIQFPALPKVVQPGKPPATTGWAVALAADGSMAIAGNDGTVYFWHRASNNVKHLFTLAPEDSSNGLHFLVGPRGDTVTCLVHKINRVVVWDVALNRKLHQFERPFEGGVSCLAYSPDGKRLIWNGHAEAVKPGMTTMSQVGCIIDLDVKRAELLSAKGQ